MLRLLPLPLLAAPALAIPVTVELDLVEDDAAFNRLQITVDPQVDIPFVNLSDTETSVLTGNMFADLEVDPASGEISSMTLREGRVAASDVTFNRSVFGNGYTVAGANLGGEVVTPNPPGVVSGSTGEFDAAQYAFQLDQGSLNGSATILGTTTPIDLVVDPAEPITGQGSGMGTVDFSPDPTDDGSGPGSRFLVSLTLPVDVAQTFENEGLTVDVTASGTLKATGTLDLVADPYAAWAVAEGIAGAPREGDANGDGVANAISWALGLGADENARPWLPAATPSGGFTLALPPGGTAVPLRVVSAPGLSGWQPVPLDRLSAGTNPLPAGSSGSVQISPAGISSEYLRLEVVE